MQAQGTTDANLQKDDAQKNGRRGLIQSEVRYINFVHYILLLSLLLLKCVLVLSHIYKIGELGMGFMAGGNKILL